MATTCFGKFERKKEGRKEKKTHRKSSKKRRFFTDHGKTKGGTLKYGMRRHLNALHK